MTVHKLSAGDGYTYLTRQVASADELRPAGQSLAEYYVARGNPPGIWLGSGAHDLGLAGSQVSELQMRRLFGGGCHPDTGAPLGRRYRTAVSLDLPASTVGQANGAGTGRSPAAGSTEQSAAEEAGRTRRPVAGFDLVFSPVKSASLLWALGGPEVRRLVEDAHHEAVADTIGWLEQHAAFTRSGKAGVAQIDTTGLICAAFDHRESRTGDPDLHTHVAVANKVQGVDGRWRALDGRGLHAVGVAASERYNTRFEDALARRLGVRFTERPGGRAGKRPVREVDGIPAELIRHFSKRRAAIEDRYAELAADYRRTHTREPDRPTQLRLAQQATLETRDGKPPGRTLAQQVHDWTVQAEQAVGRRRLRQALLPAVGNHVAYTAADAVDTDAVARTVVDTVSRQRSTWSRWNLVAEIERVLRGHRFASSAAREDATDRVLERVTGPDLTIRIAEPQLVEEPPVMRRASDGQSVFVQHGVERYTSGPILLAEERLVAAAHTTTDISVAPELVEASIARHEASTGVSLDAGQRHLVEAFASTNRLLALGIGPAGAGKTTAMRAFVTCWTMAGRRVVPIAASSRAAQVLGAELGIRAENLHKFLHEARHPRDADSTDDWFRVAPGDVLLVDEAGMVGTLLLDDLTRHARQAGAVVRLLGDPHQLAAVEAGGALRLLEAEAGAAHLDTLHRFDHPDEATATLRLRDGDPAAIDFYQHAGRITSGSREAMLEAAYDAWSTDLRAGRSSVLVAAAADDVTALNIRARVERVLAGKVSAEGVELHDGTTAGVGDHVVTRTNVRSLTSHRGRDWVKNGDIWQVNGRDRDGSLTVWHLSHGGRVRLPSWYVTEHLELAYATTAHRAQGITVDTAHALVTGEMTREALYVASTRARRHTGWYVATEDILDAAAEHEPDPPQDAPQVVAAVLARTGADASATETIRETQRQADRLGTLVARYRHAWDLAARAILTDAAHKSLPAPVAALLLADPAAGEVAHQLCGLGTAGADPATTLREIADHRELSTATSAAKVLSHRLDAYAGQEGRPRPSPADRPLPSLPSPHVPHESWHRYLVERANLVRSAAATDAGPMPQPAAAPNVGGPHLASSQPFVTRASSAAARRPERRGPVVHR